LRSKENVAALVSRLGMGLIAKFYCVCAFLLLFLSTLIYFKTAA